MRLIKSNAPKEAKRVYRARVDSIWNNNEFEDGTIVIEEYAIIRKRGNLVTLDRPCSATNGMVTTDIETLNEHFHTRYSDAILHLYARFMARIEAAYENEDVLNGRISEGAAVLVGLN